MTNQEIEAMFNNRFRIELTTYCQYTFSPYFNFIDKKYGQKYSIKSDAINFENFKILTLNNIISQIHEVRDEKIKQILDEN